MTRRRFARTCLAACVVVCCANTTARGQGMAVPWTSLAEIDIKPPHVSGSIWLAADAVETLAPIDADGDVQFSAMELERVRPWLTRYINEHFRIMWEGRIQPVIVTALEEDHRGVISRRYLQVTFRVRDYPPGMEVVILSDLLNDLSPPPSCMALIEYKSRSEVFVFGPEHYYTTHPSRWVVDDDGIYRPPSRRGRITPSPNTPIEMLYAKPEGAFYLYCLMPDRYTPRPIASKTVEVTITDARSPKPTEARLTLKAMPLAGDPEGSASRFRVAAPEWMHIDAFKADLNLSDGRDRRRVIFDFPAVFTNPTTSRPGAKRYACPQLCLGVESTHSDARCPRCGSRLIEARGDNVPGTGIMGSHGGSITAMNSKGDWAELVLIAPNELRLYRTTSKLDPRPIGELSGIAMPFHSGETQGPPPRLQFTRDPQGRYLSVTLIGPMYLPGGVRCILTDGDSREPILLEFQVWEMLASPPPARPATTQSAVPREANGNRNIARSILVSKTLLDD